MPFNIISILLLNIVGQFQPVDSYSLFICAIVIGVTELTMSLWFCCSLWNYKQLGVIPCSMQAQETVDLEPWADGQVRPDYWEYGIRSSPDKVRFQFCLWHNMLSTPLLAAQLCTHACVQLLSFEPLHCLDSDEGDSLEDSSEEGCCWVYQGVIEDPGDLFYPCNCKLHKKCIKQWVEKRASNASIPEKEYLKYQVCRRRYRVKRNSCLCLLKGLQRKHWLQLVCGLLIIAVSVGGCVYTDSYSSLNATTKIVIISSITIIDVIFFKLIGFGMVWLYRKNKYTVMDIQGLSVDK